MTRFLIWLWLCLLCAPALGQSISVSGPNATTGGGYPNGATAITAAAQGTTGSVVATLPNAANKFTYICGFSVSGFGTAATVSFTIAGIVTASQIYQIAIPAVAATTSQTFTPCIPSSAVNTAITATTSADATGTAVDVNTWGFQQ